VHNRGGGCVQDDVTFDEFAVPNPFAAKVEGGKRLMAGDTLPIRP
jgi:hypothetical protein